MTADHREPTTFAHPRIQARRSRRASGGFTLVELLMVIAIIAMLMGMLSVAVWRALDYAKQAKIIVEIGQLQSAMQGYKEKNIQYPPCMGESVVPSRKVHFMRHVQVAFSNANYGVTSAHFDNLTTALKSAYSYRNAGGAPSQLDLTTLDQAEALVFWLGGLPTPCSTAGVPIAASRLFGFNADRDSPFKRDSASQEGTDAMRFRTQPMFDFVQDRLTDNDNDGWYEYSPVSYKEGEQPAPFVYFDAPTYVAATTPPGTLPFNIVNLSGYPRFGDTTALSFAGIWGMAVPLGEAYAPGTKTPMRWKRPDTFQIIAPGKDGMYSAPISSSLAAAMRLPIFPAGDSYTKSGNYTSRTSYSKEELDNLTNLGDSTLDEARQSAR